MNIYEEILQAENNKKLYEIINKLEKDKRRRPAQAQAFTNLIEIAKARIIPETEGKEHNLFELLQVVATVNKRWEELPSDSLYKKDTKKIIIQPLNVSMVPKITIPYPTMALLFEDNTFSFIKYAETESDSLFFCGMCDVVTGEPIASDNIIDYTGTVADIKGKKAYVFPATFLLEPGYWEKSYLSILTEEINKFLASNPNFIQTIFDAAKKLQSPLLTRKPIKKYRW